MKQPHTEQAVSHTDDQQNTGNHKKPSACDAGGADRFGGTRTGAENVEPAVILTGDSHEESVEAGTVVDQASGLDQVNESQKDSASLNERHPERDESGRM